MALFGSYLLALLLLPLAHSCESTKPMADVIEHYTNAINPLLQNIDKNITNVLEDQNCVELKKKYACDPNKETRSIHRMVCSIRFKQRKKAMSKIKCDLWKLTEDITHSLECYCSVNEDYTQSKINCTHPDQQKLSKERLCRLRSIVRDIKRCYMVLTEKNSQQKEDKLGTLGLLEYFFHSR